MAQTKVEITAEDKTAAAFKSAERNLNAWSNKMSALQGVMAGVATGALATLINKGLTFADTLDELSKKTGFSTTKLQELTFAGSQLGAKSDDINEALLRFTRTIGEAANGSDQAREALGRVGISVDDLKRKSVEQLFDQAQGSMARMTSETQRLAIANDIFGRGSKEVANFLSAQAGEMDALRIKAHEMGAVLSEQSIAKAKETKDKFEALARVISVQLSEAVVAIAPLLTNMASGLSNLAQWSSHIAKNLGLIARSTEEEYVALLQTRQRLADSIQGTEGTLNSWLNRLMGPSEDAKKRLAALRAELALIDQQLAQARQKMADEDKKQPTQKGAVDNIEQSAKEKAQAKEDALLAKRDADKQAKEDQRLIDERVRLDQHYADRLTRIQQSFLTENELELQQYEERQAVIQANFELGRISEEERNRLMEDAETQHQARLRDIAQHGSSARSRMYQAAFAGDLGAMKGVMGEMSALMMSGSKKMFQIGKAAALSEAAISMFLGIQNALATKPFFPVGLAMGAHATATGLMNLAKIRSVQFGGGGGGAATPTFSANPGTGLPVTDAGGANALPDLSAQAQPQRPERVVNIMIDSDTVVSGAWIRDRLIPEINDAVGDGVIVNVSGRLGAAV